MNVQITGVSMKYKENIIDGVNVQFKAQNEDRTININGFIPLTADQYAGNESLSDLEDVVRQEVANKIVGNSVE